jgi:eukaryotic-like serine/threonine-protein kinase
MSTPAISGYTFDACRGSGAFGSVWKALWSSEFECAVKVLTPGTWHPHYLSWCLERLRQEGERTDFVRIYSYDLTNNPPHLSMALLPEGTLSLEQLSGRLPQREAWVLLDSLAESLAWLHTEGIVHTGLSTGNVFVCSTPSGEPMVLLSDVGQGWLTGCPVARLHGQMAFIAPEHWRAATHLLQEGRALGRDVYAFGVIAWRLLTGQWPRGTQVFDAIMAGHAEDLNLQADSFADWLEKESANQWPAEPASAEEENRRKIVEQCLDMDSAVRFSDMKAALDALRLCPLPPVAGSLSEAPATPALEGVTTTDAFDQDKPAPPRRRRFSLPLPRLSKSLQENREDARPAGRGVFAPAMAVVSLLACAGAGAYAFKERNARRTAEGDLNATKATVRELTTRLPKTENEAATARSEAQAARAEQAAATRHNAEELIVKLLASEPVDETADIPGWRTALRVIDAHCSEVLHNAPADAGGMESRWQLARLKAALGDEAGALPILEKLTRDLEATAIAAAGDFPAELGRLTGRVESLLGHILTDQRRTEEALPHLKKGSDSFEKWVKANPNDTESVRTYAQNLYLEGHTLTARGQLEPARSALMKIEGYISKPADSDLRPEDRFLLADAHLELGKIDALDASAQISSDPAGKENTARLLESAVAKHYDGIKLLIAYDEINRKSVPNRTRMAQGFIELGRIFVRLDNPKDASIAYNESIKIYSEMLKEHPENDSYKISLATVYNEYAQLKYTTNPAPATAKDALGYQNSSVDFLTVLNSNTTLDNGIRLLLAASMVLNGELLLYSGNTKDALKRQTDAITLTTELLSENSLSEKERRECRRISARAWTGTARLHEHAGHRDDTVAALTKAYADWEFSPVEDPSDLKEMAWVKDKLAKVKPGTTR